MSSGDKHWDVKMAEYDRPEASMATMVGRECWHVVGAFTHGKVIEQTITPDGCTILTDSGERKLVAPSNVLLTLDAAIAEVEETVWYWQRALQKLEAERQKRSDD